MAELGHVAKDMSNQHWHFVGILGTGMSNMARYAAELGIRITGSDMQLSPVAEDLLKRGITVQGGHEAANLRPDTNLVVVSQAVDDDNPELVEAQRLGVDVVKFPELLGELMDLKDGVAVSGSHGKTTTTALIAYVMRQAGFDPSFLIGADVPQLGGGSHSGKGRHLVAEACEYKRSFLYLAPKVGVITNIDLEHTDYYYDLDDIKGAFCDFAEQVDPDGALVLNADDPNSAPLRKAADCNVVRYALDAKKAEYRAERVWRAKKHTNFNLVYKGKSQGRFSTQLYGTHNVYNALAALAACHEAGVDFDAIRQPLADFEGAARRLQLLGEPWDIAILSDYAHHPREVQASIAATQQRFPKRRIFCIFQPHQFARTRTMLSELADAFDDAWVTYVTDIYAARDTEEDMRSVSAGDLVHLMSQRGMQSYYVPEFTDLEDIIVGDVVPRDVVLVMGAGNIWQIAHNVVPRVDLKGRKQIAA